MTSEERLQQQQQTIDQQQKEDAAIIHQLVLIAREALGSAQSLERTIAAQGEEIQQFIGEWRAYLTTIHPKQ